MDLGLDKKNVARTFSPFKKTTIFWVLFSTDDTSVLDPDRTQSVSGSGSGFGIRIQEGKIKNDLQKYI